MNPEGAFDAEARAATAEWLRYWARVGPLLAQRRTTELRQLTEEESARIAVDLLWPMAQPGSGDGGKGLEPMRDALRRLANARA